MQPRFMAQNGIVQSYVQFHTAGGGLLGLRHPAIENDFAPQSYRGVPPHRGALPQSGMCSPIADSKTGVSRAWARWLGARGRCIYCSWALGPAWTPKLLDRVGEATTPPSFCPYAT